MNMILDFDLVILHYKPAVMQCRKSSENAHLSETIIEMIRKGT